MVYRSGSADLYAIKSVDSDTQLTLTRNITTAFSGASYGIITAETASTSSFANQLASAFAFWRSVVEGWSMALTGSGNITLTDPITGKQVTVPAIGGMAKASDLNALAKLTGGNKLDGSQVITSDNAGFILGKNSDLALLKNRGKAGQLPLVREHRSEFSVQERPLCHRQIPLMTFSLLGPITRRLCPVGYQLAATSITRQRGRF
ncbi:hypothetical protein LNP25_19700 [Klebsiella variicola subsp. variicola]|nr:hypothetical protein [Klebsiella variicola subsp. variicola]